MRRPRTAGRGVGGRLSATLALSALLILTSCRPGGSDGDRSTTRGTRPATNAATAPLLPTEVDALPAFDFARFEALGSQLRGTPVVVNIWASWCGPCRKEAPDLAVAADRYGERVQFLGVDILDTRGDAARFIDEHGWTYPSVFDERGEIRDRLGFVGQPETLFYDREGRLVTSWTGPVTPGVMKRNIEKIL